MRYALIALLAAVALVVSACGDDDEPATGAGETDAAETQAAETAADPIVMELEVFAEEGGEGDATATLTAVGENQTAVDIEYPLAESGDEPRHPAHIHVGGCEEELGEIAYPLEDISGGSSQTSLDVALEELQDGDYAINVHKSAAEMDVHLACGEIP